MDFIMSIFNFIIDMGAAVMMPIILIIIGLIMGAKFGDVVRAGVTFGIGFIGLNLVIGLMSSTITPVANDLVKNLGFKLTAIDTGWATASALAWSTEIVPLVFMAILLTNVVMLLFGLTKTMDIDIWNYWHALFIASCIVLVTGNVFVAVLSSIINMAICFKLADWTQKDCEEVLGLEGISLPHMQAVNWAIITYPLNWLLDRIPGVKDIEWTTDGIVEKLGLLGEPMMLGLIIGGLLSAAAQFSAPDVNVITTIQQIFIVGMNVAAVLLLIPRMISLLMEGLMVISEATQEFLNKRFPGKEIYIGLDAAVATGHPFVIATGLLMIPITLLLAFILPGNTTLPLADLSVLTFAVIFSVVPCKGNLFRALIMATITMIIVLYVASYAAPYMTGLASNANLTVPEGAAQLTCLGAAFQWYSWIPFALAKFFLT